MNTCFKFQKKDDKTADIYIDDVIGEGLFGGVSAKDFRRQLEELGEVDNITLQINSPGGDIIDGFAIFNMLSEHSASVATKINGWAASMASIIAMAADPGQVEMPSNAWFMIHNPWSVAVGGSEDMRSIADVMDKMKDHAIRAYQRHIDVDSQAISQWMDNETWFDGSDAEGLGWNFSFTDPLQIAASVSPFLSEDKVPEDAKAWIKRAQEVTDAVAEPDSETPADPQNQSGSNAVNEQMAAKFEEGRQYGYQERQPEIDSLTGKVDELNNQVNSLNEQYNQLSQELENQKTETETERREKQSLNDQLANLLPGTGAPPLESEPGDAKAEWRRALAECGNDVTKARKEYPEAWQAIRQIDRAKANNRR